MCCATVFAIIGSMQKCGLPSACTSPAARVSCCGAPINLTPCDACTRPGLPTSSFALRAFCKSGGSQPISSSAPPSIKTSALRSDTTKLGRASTKCGSSVGLARTVISALSPPISCATAPKSGNVETTLSLACASSGRSRSNGVMEYWSNLLNLFVFMRFFWWLKLVRAVRAEDEFNLQEDGVLLVGVEEEHL